MADLREHVARVIGPIKMKPFEIIRAEWEEWHRTEANLDKVAAKSGKSVSQLLDAMAQDEYDSNEPYRLRLLAKADTILALIKEQGVLPQ